MPPHPFLVPLTVPRGTYPGQTEPISTIGSASFIVARPDLDVALVHRFAAALHKTRTVRGQADLSGADDGGEHAGERGVT